MGENTADQNSLSKRPTKVTIQDVARSLNMTKGTVSRALNNYGDIAAETRARVRAEADRMGYVPMALAQAIRTGRAKSIGLVIQEDELGGFAPFLADFLAGVSTAASKSGWTLTVATANTMDGVLEVQSRLISERKADGFILPRSRVSDPRVDKLVQANVPFVVFGREPKGIQCDWFDVAGEDAMHDAVSRLVKFGHSRIGFLKAGEDYVYSGLRERGYVQGLASAGLPFASELVAKDVMTLEQGSIAARKLLSLEVPPTAIVCSVDRAALGVYRTASEAGMEIGKDLSVISYDGIPEGEFAVPALTTYSVNRRHAGTRLTQILIDRIRNSDAEAFLELVPAQLIERASDGPPRCSSADLAKLWHTSFN
ncbi:MULTISPECIES: LacI family DNA-binding transcriptional regulator [unclassified Ruegeria]|uniref:LacI family DNA-binding transcriptional regulator n=1 Tax=unclassified Ruegeria TaxID=2625375 RepID=UPI001488FCD7|nr:MULTISPECIES: substrate-binding domain-containing protein [unclassified Ruegeria]